MSRAVLVTGGAGYIGSHACKALAQAGYLPVAYDNLSRGHRWAVKWGPFEQGDIADGQRLRAALLRYRPVAVMHFAAYAYVSESVQHPALYYRNNVAGSLNLLEAMRSAGTRALVFSSTCATYGVPDCLPIREDHPQRPLNPYGASKLAVERMLGDFDAAYGLRSISLRYFNAAGADPDGEIGEAHIPETHLIPLVMETAAGRRESVEVFGDDYDTPDGTCIRDYIHVSDLADAHVLAMRWLLDGGYTHHFNLGNGDGFSVREVIKTAQRVTGRPIPKRFRPPRLGDPPALVSDATKARAVLNWRPKHAALATQLGDAWKWHQKMCHREQERILG